MNNTSIIDQFLSEFEAEITSTRKCIERIPDTLFTWKPHERSMEMDTCLYWLQKFQSGLL